MIIHTDFDQGSHIWHQKRLGKITGSDFVKLTGTKEARKKYLFNKASERITGYKSDALAHANIIHLERGKTMEEFAREQYKFIHLIAVKQVSLVELNDYVACSPDGFIEERGLIEIKCPDSHNYMQNVIELMEIGESAIKQDYKMQMQFNMFVCDKDYCDYVMYNQNFASINKELYTYRVYKNEETQKLIADILEESIVKIEEYINSFQQIMSHAIYNKEVI